MFIRALGGFSRKALLPGFLTLTFALAARAQVPSSIGERLGNGEKLTIVTYGTSLTAGGGWVRQIKQALDAKFPGRVELVNAAKGGMNSEWGVANLDERVLARKPDVVFIEFAVNDAVERFHLSVPQARRNLESMIDRIRRSNPKTEIVLQVTNPVIDRPKGHDGYRPTLEETFAMVRAVAKEKGTVLIDHEGAWKRELERGEAHYHELVPDGLHPNERGYAAVATPRILAALGVSGAGAVSASPSSAEPDDGVTRSEILVYGGTSAAVIAAVQAKQMGRKVVLLTPDKHLGGMTSGGLGWTDLGDKRTIGGLSREFYRRIYDYYQNDDAWTMQRRDGFGGAAQGTSAMDEETKTMWVFEPRVAEKIFDRLLEENDVPVVHGRLDLGKGVAKRGPRIEAIRTEDGRVFSAAVFIDATYEGDLMAKAGVSYAVGREPNRKYGETHNGIQVRYADKNQLPKGISPYVTPGDPGSGLLPGVNPGAGGRDGEGDDKIQAYCYRMVLTDAPKNRVPIERPQDYDEADYEILFRAIEAGQTSQFLKFDLVPNRKTDSNNASGISTDFIGMNYAYPEAGYAEREKIARAHERWQRGLIWTLQNHLRVPRDLRDRYRKWGLPKDEFTDNGNWPHQLYVREARRMLGDVVMTEQTLRDKRSVKRSIGMGSYKMDSHNVQRIVDANGHLINEGDVQKSTDGPYQIDYGSIIPHRAEAENLLVPVCLSASHIAYGSIRMEPVFMILAQSAATAAALAVEKKVPVQAVGYAGLKARLLEDGQVLELD